jgi:4-hydroxyproline epimerase
MFEPRGHDMMSGAILYPPTREDCDVGVLYIETSGCLPMCGHGTIGTVTFALERGLVQPAEPGVLRLDTPAGRVDAHFTRNGAHVEAVRIVNVGAYLAAEGVEADCPELGRLSVDIAYGGNFYAIVEPQEHYRDMADLSAGDILRLSPILRDRLNETVEIGAPGGSDHPRRQPHPLDRRADPERGPRPKRCLLRRQGHRPQPRPCGTGTSARMAQLAARGALGVGDDFVHESIIGSLFRGRVEVATTVGNRPGIVPSVEGWARLTGFNTIFIEDRDPYAHGFQVT